MRECTCIANELPLAASGSRVRFVFADAIEPFRLPSRTRSNGGSMTFRSCYIAIRWKLLTTNTGHEPNPAQVGAPTLKPVFPEAVL